jgi:hypothetical protein
MNGKALLARNQAWSLGHRPALEDAVELEAEIVVQARGVVLLDAEGEAVPFGRLALGLGGLPEIALGVVFGEQLGHSRSQTGRTRLRSTAEPSPRVNGSGV